MYSLPASRRLYLAVVLAVALFVSVNAQATKCTGYPKLFNGKPCASTTRYYDGNMGACGCGTSNTNPFSWQYSKPTAAASPAVFGAGTWCGSGCGKCFKLTPTAIGASPLGTGAKSLTPLVVKVTNLCPPVSNEAWCSYDVNSFGYDAHFDLMDQNMAGIISNMGWNNPEVTYEEVDCAVNGFKDWGCQCAAGAVSTPVITPAKATAAAPTKASGNSKATAAPTAKAATTAPTAKAATTAPKTATTASNIKAATTAPSAKAATTSPVSSKGLEITVLGGSSIHWFGFQLDGSKTFSLVQVKDSSKSGSWITLAYQGDGVHWGMYSASTAGTLVLPLSLKFTPASGQAVTATNIITSFSPLVVKTGLSL